MHTWILAAAVCAVVAGPAVAADSASDARVRGELDTVREQIVRAKADQDKLERELAAMRAESAVLSGKLVDLAARLQNREALIDESERRLARLTGEEDAMRLALIVQRKALGELLAGLQLLQQNPPPPIVTRPDDTVSAIRGAMLFGSVVPALKRQASRLARDLTRLDEVRARISHEQNELKHNFASLQDAKTDMQAVLKRKQGLIAQTDKELGSVHTRTKKLADKAKSLNQLVAALKREKARAAARDAQRAELEKKRLQEEKQRLAAIRNKPAMAFSSAKGRISYPATGTRIREFGEPDGFGGHTKGVSIATRKAAQVTAPADGKVEFAGHFRSYGELLILDVGEGYHVLMAGLGEISVQAGQFIRAGEPVGQMGAEPARATLIGDRLETAKPILYIEFRRNGGSIDPTPWWAGNRKEARK